MDDKIQELKKRIAELEKEVESSKRKGGKREEETKEDEKFLPHKILYKWTSPSRVFVPRDRAWFLKIATVALLFILFFAFLQDFFVILVICIIVLIFFLLASIPPDKVEHQITTRGIKSIGKLYKWKDFRSFWVAEKLGYTLVYVETKLGFPSRLTLVIKAKDEIKIVELLMRELDPKEFEKKQSWLSRMSEGEMVNPDKYLKLFKRKSKGKKKDRIKKSK